MPVKKVPNTLIKRLKKIIKKEKPKQGTKRIYSVLGKMKIADHRSKEHSENTKAMFNRVREMNVSRNFPETKFVLKRTFHGTAKYTLAYVKRTVRKHNKIYGKGENYFLVAPNASVLSENIIAMAKTDAPNIKEISGHKGKGKTKRGINFFNDLKKKYGFSKKQFKDAAEKVCLRTKIDKSNLLLISFSKGKFVFMPLVDLT